MMIDHCAAVFQAPATGARRTGKTGRADNGGAGPPAGRHPLDILRPARRRADWGYPLFVATLSHLPDRPAHCPLPAAR